MEYNNSIIAAAIIDILPQLRHSRESIGRIKIYIVYKSLARIKPRRYMHIYPL